MHVHSLGEDTAVSRLVQVDTTPPTTTLSASEGPGSDGLQNTSDTRAVEFSFTAVSLEEETRREGSIVGGVGVDQLMAGPAP